MWTLIGLAILVTYKSSGATDNVWPAVFGFLSTGIIALMIVWRGSEWKKLTRIDTACLILGVLSLLLWLAINDSKELSQYALYLAIIADACAAIPTINFVWRHPKDDRPVPWFLYALGYGLAIFAISDHSFANYALPVYMFINTLIIILPLVIYRCKNKSSWRDWI